MHIIFVNKEMKEQCQILRSHYLYIIRFGKTAACFQFNSIFSEKLAITSTYLEKDKKRKKEVFLIISQHLFFNLLNGICFPLYA